MISETDREPALGIRAMVMEDVPTVVKLERQIFPDPWSAAGFKELISDKDWTGLVAESDGRIVGYACYYIVAGESHLANIAVDAKFRRKSVAKRLLDNILQVVKSRQCEYMFLEVRPTNSGAIAFYEKFGFKVLYRRPEYYRKPVEDALVMGCVLTDSEDDHPL